MDKKSHAAAEAEKPVKDQLLIRFGDGGELRGKLEAAAGKNSRNLTAEILVRLAQSLELDGVGPNLPERIKRMEKSMIELEHFHGDAAKQLLELRSRLDETQELALRLQTKLARQT